MRIGISIGDINGIGPEIVLKTFASKKMRDFCTPILFGAKNVVEQHTKFAGDSLPPIKYIKNLEHVQKGKLNVFSCWEEEVEITLGQATEEGGKYAALALEETIMALKDGKIDGMVTAPINKAAMKASGWKYPGHTEYLSKRMEGSSLMMLLENDLRVALVTNHIPVKDVASSIDKDTILKKLDIFYRSLEVDFGIEKPHIAILGLNPHASDQGAIGKEEAQIISPAIKEAKKTGKLVSGPFSADGFFGSSNFKKFDGILAMYHDQGLAPFKTLSFGQGTNYTAGLKHVRTSPDHGTGYDIVGKGEASISSFRNAVYAAIDIVRARRQYNEDRANVLVKSAQERKSGDRRGGKPEKNKK